MCVNSISPKASDGTHDGSDRETGNAEMGHDLVQLAKGQLSVTRTYLV